MCILEMNQKMEKKFFAFKIIAFELVAVNSHCYKESSCHRESMCPNISHITKKDISRVSFLQSDEKFDKSAVMQTS